MPPPAPRPAAGWPAWAVTWAAILLATAAAVVVLARLSADAARAGLERALGDHLAAAAGMADGALHELPIEVLAALDGEKSMAEVATRVDDLATHGGLRGLALLGPGGEVVGHGGEWVPAPAERDLIARASAGETVAGPLYQDGRGELYATAYRPLTGHAGWVVAAEGRAATLGAIESLRRTQRTAGLAVLGFAAVLGGLLAALVSRPIRRFGQALAAVRPGAPPTDLPVLGPRELRQVAVAARQLLAAIRARDTELAEAHQREVAQLHRMAAEIAHEVGNPLNAMSLTIARVGTVEDPARRGAAVERLRGQLAELETIVVRLRDLTRPLTPTIAPVRLPELVDSLVDGLSLRVDRAVPDLTLRTDAGLVVQILRNLLANAAQAGAGAAWVRVERLGSEVRIAVGDDGPGIPDAEVARIFDWFHTTRATGTGIGLPISRRIAEALGGHLDLVSARPVTFHLTLPAEAP